MVILTKFHEKNPVITLVPSWCAPRTSVTLQSGDSGYLANLGRLRRI